MDSISTNTVHPAEVPRGAAPILTANDPPEPDDPDRGGSSSQGDAGSARGPTALRALVTERNCQKFATFERQFRRAADELAEQQGEPELAKVTVSLKQFERWYAGQVKTTPHPDACRVLEIPSRRMASMSILKSGRSQLRPFASGNARNPWQ